MDLVSLGRLVDLPPHCGVASVSSRNGRRGWTGTMKFYIPHSVEPKSKLIQIPRCFASSCYHISRSHDRIFAIYNFRLSVPCPAQPYRDLLYRRSAGDPAFIIKDLETSAHPAELNH